MTCITLKVNKAHLIKFMSSLAGGTINHSAESATKWWIVFGLLDCCGGNESSKDAWWGG